MLITLGFSRRHLYWSCLLSRSSNGLRCDQAPFALVQTQFCPFFYGSALLVYTIRLLRKIPRKFTRFLVSGYYGVPSGVWREGVIGYQNAGTVLVRHIDASLSGPGWERARVIIVWISKIYLRHYINAIQYVFSEAAPIFAGRKPSIRTLQIVGMTTSTSSKVSVPRDPLLKYYAKVLC